jgi:hypothetical protein
MNLKKPVTNQINLFPPKKILRRMDMIADQNGIYRRYLQEGNNWKLHLSNTKRFIIECLTDSDAKQVAILGSGWLLDIPVNFLAEHPSHVFFYDLRHPGHLPEKFKAHRNFHFITLDITGGLINRTYNLFSGRRKPGIAEIVGEFNAPAFKLPEPSDYIISVNLLNQLDILLVDYIKKYCKLESKSEFSIRKKIQEAHLKLLSPGHSCLITDYEEVHLDNRNSIIGKKPLIQCTLPAGKYRKTWTWNFDTQKTYNPDHRTAMNVIAIKL